jgi:hypothetical protein
MATAFFQHQPGYLFERVDQDEYEEEEEEEEEESDYRFEEEEDGDVLTDAIVKECSAIMEAQATRLVMEAAVDNNANTTVDDLFETVEDRIDTVSDIVGMVAAHDRLFKEARRRCKTVARQRVRARLVSVGRFVMAGSVAAVSAAVALHFALGAGSAATVMMRAYLLVDTAARTGSLKIATKDALVLPCIGTLVMGHQNTSLVGFVAGTILAPTVQSAAGALCDWTLGLDPALTMTTSQLRAAEEAQIASELAAARALRENSPGTYATFESALAAVRDPTHLTTTAAMEAGGSLGKAVAAIALGQALVSATLPLDVVRTRASSLVRRMVLQQKPVQDALKQVATAAVKKLVVVSGSSSDVTLGDVLMVPRDKYRNHWLARHLFAATIEDVLVAVLQQQSTAALDRMTAGITPANAASKIRQLRSAATRVLQQQQEEQEPKSLEQWILKTSLVEEESVGAEDHGDEEAVVQQSVRDNIQRELLEAAMRVEAHQKITDDADAQLLRLDQEIQTATGRADMGARRERLVALAEAAKTSMQAARAADDMASLQTLTKEMELVMDGMRIDEALVRDLESQQAALMERQLEVSKLQQDLEHRLVLKAEVARSNNVEDVAAVRDHLQSELGNASDALMAVSRAKADALMGRSMNEQQKVAVAPTDLADLKKAVQELDRKLDLGVRNVLGSDTAYELAMTTGLVQGEQQMTALRTALEQLRDSATLSAESTRTLADVRQRLGQRMAEITRLEGAAVEDLMSCMMKPDRPGCAVKAPLGSMFEHGAKASVSGIVGLATGMTGLPFAGWMSGAAGSATHYLLTNVWRYDKEFNKGLVAQRMLVASIEHRAHIAAVAQAVFGGDGTATMVAAAKVLGAAYKSGLADALFGRGFGDVQTAVSAAARYGNAINRAIDTKTTPPSS